MAELESLCSSLNWKSVKTYLQTGNVVFSSECSGKEAEQDLEAAIESRFGFAIPVIVRSSDDFGLLVDSSPLAEQAAKAPSQVLLYLTKEVICPGAPGSLHERAVASEEVFVQEDSMWIHFPNGVGSSKLNPAVIDRAVGSVATGRNWNTATRIQSRCTR